MFLTATYKKKNDWLGGGGEGMLFFSARFLSTILWPISVLAEDAIKAALNDYKIKNQPDAPPDVGLAGP